MEILDPETGEARPFRYMKPETHREARRAVMQLGSDQDKAEWDALENDPNRDVLRAKIAQFAILRAENELLRRESNNPQSVGAGLVDVPGR
jgi:hypothetical protein